jgi:hypothetical protein
MNVKRKTNANIDSGSGKKVLALIREIQSKAESSVTVKKYQNLLKTIKKTKAELNNNPKIGINEHNYKDQVEDNQELLLIFHNFFNLEHKIKSRKSLLELQNKVRKSEKTITGLKKELKKFDEVSDTENDILKNINSIETGKKESIINDLLSRFTLLEKETSSALVTLSKEITKNCILLEKLCNDEDKEKIEHLITKIKEKIEAKLCILEEYNDQFCSSKKPSQEKDKELTEYQILELIEKSRIAYENRPEGQLAFDFHKTYFRGVQLYQDWLREEKDKNGKVIRHGNPKLLDALITYFKKDSNGKYSAVGYAEFKKLVPPKKIRGDKLVKKAGGKKKISKLHGIARRRDF